jgi:hypothetical protein
MPSKKDLDRFMGEMGEAIVAYELMKCGWDVMKHLGGEGYDLLASKPRITRAIEVKTTDPERRTGKTRKNLTAGLSPAERNAADFLVYYIHGFDTYFVIPKSVFQSRRTVTVFIGKDGRIGSKSAYEPYRKKWEGLD